MIDYSPQQKLEDAAECWRAGDLSYLLQRHQEDDYTAFRAWNLERQQPGYRARIKELDALYDNMWMDECSRRHGKTAGRELIPGVEEMIRRPGCRGMIATPLEKSVGGIIVPLTKILFRDAPPGYFPRFVTQHKGDGKGLYIDATDSFCKLIGLDKNPDATRGEYLDWAVLDEAAFIKGLYELVTGTIMPQFRYRPWAWLELGSSTAKVADCDFNTHFREDCRLRGAYRMHTIRDNTSLTEDDIDQEERRSGGKNSAQCRRELYCELTRDPNDMVVPEFDESVHVVDSWPMPAYALALEGIDPGITDPLGLVGGFVDWLQQCLVIQFAWARSNASTGEVVRVLQDFERTFWGSAHRAAGERKRELSIADALVTGDGKVWAPPQDGLTYWSQEDWSLKANPYARVCDIENRFIVDMNVDYGMNVQPAVKGPGSADADLQHVRTLFGARPRKIAIIRNGHTEPLIQQCRSGEWNTDETGHRTDWKRSKTLGHLDCFAALKYLARVVPWQRNPNRPAHVEPNSSEYHVPQPIRDQAKGNTGAPTWGGRSNSGFAAPSGRSTFR